MAESTWIDALAATALPKDDVIGVDVAGRDLAICTVGDAVYAIDNICTHGQACLSDGFLDGHQIECPLHQGRFDVRNGQPLCDPVEEPLRSYPVKIEDGRVYVQLD
jgi:naphthalene 1,2-dioxygenase system ferredoxin subunit